MRAPRSGPGTSPASWGSSNSGCTCSCGRHYRSTSPAPAPRGRRCRRRSPGDMSRNVRSRAWTFSKVRSLRASRGHARQGGPEGFDVQLAAVDAEGGVAELLEGLERQRADVDRLGRDAQVLHQVERVGPGPLRSCRSRASSGRGSAARSMPSMSQVLTATSSDERRVEPAGDADVQRRVRREAARSAWPAPRTGCRRSRRSGGAARAPPRGTNGVPGTNALQAGHVRGERRRRSAGTVGRTAALVEAGR